MRTIITIFKHEIRYAPELLERIKVNCSDFLELPDAYSFTPKPGELFETLSILQKNNITYGTQYVKEDGI